MADESPDFDLQDAYRVYKADTQSFVQGLLDRNGICKEPWREASSQETNAVYALRIGQIKPLAEHVVGASCSAGPIAGDILQSLRRAIDLRRRCSLWYKRQAVHLPSLRASNDRHDHFTGILEETYGILWPHRVQQEESPHEQQTEPLEIREVEDTDQTLSHDAEHPAHPVDSNDDSHTPISVSSASASASVASRSQVKKTERSKVLDEDSTMSLFSLFEATKELNLTIQDVWKRYRDHQISLVVASAKTEMAISLVQRIEKTFLASFPQHTDWKGVMRTLLPDLSQIAATDKESFETSMEEDLRSSFYFPCEQLRRSRQAWADRKGLSPSIVLRQVPSASSGEHQSTAQEIWQDSQTILYEVLYEIFVYASQGLQGRTVMPTEDQMTRGVREVIRGEKISLWVLFALQSFLDSQQILGADATRGCRELAATVRSAMAITEDYISYSEIIQDAKYTEKDKQHLPLGIERYGL